MTLSKAYQQIMIILGLSIAEMAMLFYAFSKNSRDWLFFCLVLMIVLVVIILRATGDFYQNEKIRRQLERMTKNIVNHQPVSPLFVRPGNPYKQIADQLTELQSRQQDASKTIKNSNTELVTILSSLPVGIMVIDSSQDVIFANHRMASTLQHTIMNQPHPYSQDIRNYQLLSLIEKVFNDHHSQHAEVRSVGDNSQTWDTSVVFNQLDNDFHVSVIVYDISDIINVKQMQIDFLRNASHELKTPVTAISGFAKTLLGGAMDDRKTLVEFLKIIDQQSTQLTSLIQDVLTISHIQNGGPHQTQAINLKDFVDSHLESYISMARVQDISLINQVPENAVINGDPQNLTRIFQNLVSNAIKYNRPSGSVTIGYSANDSFWQLKVSDTGIGIAQKDTSRLFERFYRADDSRTKQKVSGTGLGLAIVKELVDAIGGVIHVKSQRGVGSTFTVEFPINESDTGDSTMAHKLNEPPAAPNSNLGSTNTKD
ncbi:sensor histidine kinase [Lentilactobacillus parafarraginis]|nr:ATP-binding protein [Lentilactobacillus parafarraginis]